MSKSGVIKYSKAESAFRGELRVLECVAIVLLRMKWHKEKPFGEDVYFPKGFFQFDVRLVRRILLAPQRGFLKPPSLVVQSNLVFP